MAKREIVSFSTLQIKPQILKSLSKYSSMSEIQTLALPHILEHKNILALAPTGSGKSLLFAIAALQNLDPKLYKPQSLIISPTKELAIQSASVIKELAKNIPNIKISTLIGGEKTAHQLKSLAHPPHIIVATTGRLMAILEHKPHLLESVNLFVLDEIDKMVDINFYDDIKHITAHLPKRYQNIYTSATADNISDIHSLCNNLITIDIKDNKNQNLSEIAYLYSDKISLLPYIFHKHNLTQTLLFCNTKESVKESISALENMGITAYDFHGELESSERLERLEMFKNGSINILVTTDLVGRGIDISSLESIINIDIPQHSERYTHRIGRVARADAKGIAITIIGTYEIDKFNSLNRDVKIIEDIKIDRDLTIDPPKFKTIKIGGGKRDKISKGDILGAIASTNKIELKDIGTITIYDNISYIVINSLNSQQIYTNIKNVAIKGQRLRKWLLE